MTASNVDQTLSAWRARSAAAIEYVQPWCCTLALLYVQWNARLAIGDWLARERWQRCSFPDRPGFARLPGIEPSWLRFRTRPSCLRPRVLAARRSSPRPCVAVGTACSNQQPLHGSTRPQLPHSACSLPQACGIATRDSSASDGNQVAPSCCSQGTHSSGVDTGSLSSVTCFYCRTATYS